MMAGFPLTLLFMKPSVKTAGKLQLWVIFRRNGEREIPAQERAGLGILGVCGARRSLSSLWSAVELPRFNSKGEGFQHLSCCILLDVD